MNQYKMLLDHMGDIGIYVIDKEDYRVLYYNKIMKKYTPNITIGTVCYEYFQTTCPSCPIKGLDEQHSHNRTVSITCPVSPEIELSATTVLWEKENKQIEAYMITFHPKEPDPVKEELLRKCKNMEETTNKLDAALNAAYNKQPGILLKVRIARNNVTLWGENEEFLLKMERTRSEYEKGLFLSLKEDEKKNLIQELYELANRHEQIIKEYHAVIGSGKRKWLSAKGTMISQIGHDYIYYFVLVDITEKKQVQLQLEREKKRFEIACKTTLDIIFEYDTIKDEFSFYRIYEEKEEESFLCHTIAQFKNYFEENDVVKKQDKQLIKNMLFTRSCFDLEVQLKLRDDSEYRWYRLSTRGMSDGERVFSVVGTIADIEQLKKKEEQIAVARHNEQLARQWKELRERQTMLILSQMNPHFLFNTMNDIKGYLTTNQEQANQLLDLLSKYVRYVLRTIGNEHAVSFREELGFIQTYLRIEMMRFDNLRYEEDIELRDFYLPPMTIQPLVENAVIHGICQNLNGGTVKLKVNEAMEWIVITVEDDGPGIKEEALQNLDEEQRALNGIQNVRTRMKELMEAGVVIENLQSRGTKVTVKMPKRMSMKKGYDFQ